MTEVLPAQLPEGQPYFSTSLRRSPPSQSSLLIGHHSSSSYSRSRKLNYSTSDLADASATSLPSSAPSSPRQSQLDISQSSSFVSSSSSSSTWDNACDEDNEDEISFPSYGDTSNHSSQEVEDPPPSPQKDELSSLLPFERTYTAGDDTAVRQEPSQHVDYLSHDWREEDIWSSWRHIVSRRRIYGERSRLENASWRTWAKSKYQLKTVSPETLNWLKDCDVTWLYGPLQTASSRPLSNQTSDATSNISKNNSFLNKKPILKKRSMSEIMLQKSISSSSLVKQAAAAVQAQEEIRQNRRHSINRGNSDFSACSMPSTTPSRDTNGSYSSSSTSGLQTPDQCERRHIRFDDKVEQCIAVDCKDCDDDEEEFEGHEWAAANEDDSSDDGLVMRKNKLSRTKQQLSRNNSKTSFSGESKTIAKLPSTTLKYRTDSPDVTAQAPHHSVGFFGSSKLSPSPSQETLRPSNPSANFLLPEDDDVDMSWEPSGAFQGRHDSLQPTAGSGPSGLDTDMSEESKGLRRTESGMFMPYEEDEDDAMAAGLFGRVVDTVNTARDIAHVIWNVGWRK